MLASIYREHSTRAEDLRKTAKKMKARRKVALVDIIRSQAMCSATTDMITQRKAQDSTIITKRIVWYEIFKYVNLIRGTREAALFNNKCYNVTLPVGLSPDAVIGLSRINSLDRGWLVGVHQSDAPDI